MVDHWFDSEREKVMVPQLREFIDTCLTLEARLPRIPYNPQTPI